MKVLFVADVPLENPVSGSEQVLYQQAVGLAQDGMDVYAITRQEREPDFVIREVEDVVTEGSFRANPASIWQFFSALKKHPIKIYDQFSQESSFQAIVCHQPFNCLALLLAKKLKDIPIIYIFHSPSHEEYELMHEDGSALKTFLPVTARKVIEGYCIRKACKVMTLSGFMKQKAHGFHNVSNDLITVNPGGVDLSRFSPFDDRDSLKDKLVFPKRKTHLLTIRNIEPRMGVDNLVKALSILKKDGIDVHLTIGGDGVEKQNIENLIRDLELNAEITMAGFIPADLLAQYYGAADFFVMPTRSLEGFGLVTPEALACGTPVLGTPVGGTKEILENFDAKFLFNDATPEAMAEGIKEALGKYSSDEAEYADLRNRCRQFAETNYSWKRHVDQLKALLQDTQGS